MSTFVCSVFAGFILYNWFNIIAATWKQHPNKKDLKEYASCLQNYAEEKQKNAVSAIPEAATPKVNAL